MEGFTFFSGKPTITSGRCPYGFPYSIANKNNKGKTGLAVASFAEDCWATVARSARLRIDALFGSQARDHVQVWAGDGNRRGREEVCVYILEDGVNNKCLLSCSE